MLLRMKGCLTCWAIALKHGNDRGCCHEGYPMRFSLTLSICLATISLCSACEPALSVERYSVETCTPSTKGRVGLYPTNLHFVDVTQYPYCAKGDGSTDDTRAIQQAIDDTVNRFVSPSTVYFPATISVI